MYTAWWLKTILSKELKTAGLTLEQYNVLRILNGKHPERLCVKDIGDRMIEKNSNVPRIVDRLVIKSFVIRSTSDLDKRETVIQLTAEGIKVLAVASQNIEATIDQTVSLREEDA